MTKSKQIPRTLLERTVREQEQTILHLRSRNSELEAKLAAQRKRGRKSAGRAAATHG